MLPQEADNFDLSVEHYFEPVGVISAGVFLKEINNFLYSSVVRIPPGPDNGFNGDYAGWELATSLNGGYARVRGLELNYSQQLSFLPGVWSGLGVFANYTYLQTEGNYGRVSGPPDTALVNFIPRVISAVLSYSRSRYTARINANFTDDYLRAYNANPLLSSHRKDKTIVDVKFSYQYTRQLSLFADAGNIFNAKDRWYSGPNPRFVSTVRNFGVKSRRESMARSDGSARSCCGPTRTGRCEHRVRSARESEERRQAAIGRRCRNRVKPAPATPGTRHRIIFTRSRMRVIL